MRNISEAPVESSAMLERLGLTKSEARVYLCLLERSPLSAAAIADLAETSRSSVYLVLRSLVEKGLVDAGAGYNSRYQPAPPDRALAGLLDHERAELERREQLVQTALPQLAQMYEQRTPVEGEIVEILRTPTVVAERFDRLQSEAQETIDIVVRGPVQVGGPNQAELDALRRGVRARAIYDESVVQHPAVAQHLAEWMSFGEQARLFRGDLHMKYAVFDGHTVLMPLVAPGVSGVVVIIVRNSELGAALGYLFETLWADSESLESLVSLSGTADAALASQPEVDHTDHTEPEPFR